MKLTHPLGLNPNRAGRWEGHMGCQKNKKNRYLTKLTTYNKIKNQFERIEMCEKRIILEEENM